MTTSATISNHSDMDVFDPPRTGVELVRVWEKYLQPNEAYFNGVITWAEKLSLHEWYYLDKFVKKESMVLFKYCFCYMIAVYNLPYEFKNDYSAIKRIN